jgi:hypothetical protein
MEVGAQMASDNCNEHMCCGQGFERPVDLYENCVRLETVDSKSGLYDSRKIERSHGRLIYGHVSPLATPRILYITRMGYITHEVAVNKG